MTSKRELDEPDELDRNITASSQIDVIPASLPHVDGTDRATAPGGWEEPSATPDVQDLPVILYPDDAASYLIAMAPPTGWPTGTLTQAISRVGRDGGPYLLFLLHEAGVLRAEQYAPLVLPVWNAAEFPPSDLEPDAWLELFARAGYTRELPFEDGGDCRTWPRPDQPLRLYRGAPATGRLGWSWTTDVEVARFFASRYSGRVPGKVWTTVVQPSQLLGQTDGRDEQEYVVNPFTLDPDAVVPYEDDAA